VKQRLNLLITAAVADSDQPQGHFLIRPWMAEKAYRRAKSAAITEGQHRLKAASLRPCHPGHEADLKPQRLLPACRMNTRRSPETAEGRSSVMARWSTPVRAGKVKKAIERHRLQSQRHQCMRGSEGIQIHQIKTFTPEKTVCQKTMGGPGRSPQQTMILKDGKVPPQIRLSHGIRIIGPQTAHMAFQCVSQTSHSATRHHIEDSWWSSFRQAAGKQHTQVTRGPCSRIKETWTWIEAGFTLHDETVFRVHQRVTR
jgi:hypothetical protein